MAKAMKLACLAHLSLQAAGKNSSQGVLLLQQRTTHFTAAASKEPCYDAQPGDSCFQAVTWAMDIGVKVHPDWYPSLSEASSFEALQEHLHKGGHGNCKMPCSQPSSTTDPVDPPTSVPPSTSSSPATAQQTTSTATAATTVVATTTEQTTSTATAATTVVATTTEPPAPACHTAVPGEECFNAVVWAMNHGIIDHPNWYPDWLKPSMGFELFQEALHLDGKGSCQVPCPKKLLTDETDEAVATTLGECKGNCHSDDGRCMEGLRCSHLDAESQIRGCSGKGSVGWSYCFDPAWLDRPIPTTSTTSTTTPWPTPIPGDISLRLMTFNVYWKDLESQERSQGISQAIADQSADIAVITEQWGEKFQMLESVRQKSGRNYVFCTNGPQESMWDGDILYDDDVFEEIADGVESLGKDRGLSWAVLKHRGKQRGILVYGLHPVCCGHEDVHLQNAMNFSAHLQSRGDWPTLPVVLMGDLNAAEDSESLRAYKGEQVHAFGKVWKLPVALTDTFREPASNRRASGATYHKYNLRLDYILTERRWPAVWHTRNAWVNYRAPGGSDHYPVVADVVLKR